MADTDTNSPPPEPEAPEPSPPDPEGPEPPRDGPEQSGSRFPTTNIIFFLLTVASTFFAGYMWAAPLWRTPDPPWWAGWVFAVPLLTILLFHEFGHYIAARIHGVEASLPFFIPFPLAFGTLGAIIKMRGRIAKRNALLDIGAAGPLAGMVVALPLLCWGIAISEVRPQGPGAFTMEGHSLLYKLLLFLIHGGIPPQHDIFLHPLALAGWAGLFVTMLNLLPIGQLDGGHVAYAVLGKRQDRIGNLVLWLLLLLGLGVGLYFAAQGYADGHRSWDLLADGLTGLNWFVWFLVLMLMRRFAGKNHPPVDPGKLSRPRVAVALLCFVIAVLIFMPVPLRALEIPDWITVQEGTFAMGSPAGEACRGDDEGQHEVGLTHRFEIKATLVTVGMFEALMERRPVGYPPCRADCPVVQVSWHEAAAFSNALSELYEVPTCYACTGEGAALRCDLRARGLSPYACRGFRLPTEAEWEYAARAGTGSATPRGELMADGCNRPGPAAALDEIAWHAGNSGGEIQPIASRLANDWGLHDMHGNVWEWCHDWEGAYPATRRAVDPAGAESGTNRIIRGGSVADGAGACRSASRRGREPGSRDPFVGFRVVRTVAGQRVPAAD